MDTVIMTRAGNILEVSPGCEGILKDTLTYTHRDLGNMFKPMADDKKIQFRQRPLYRMEKGKLYTLQGACSRIISTLQARGIQVDYKDMRTKKILEPDYEHLQRALPNMEFRYKQDEILATLIAMESGIIVAPTAYGKTFIMLALVALYPDAHIIMASPSTALLRGTYRRMLKISPKIGRVGGGFHEPRQVTLSTYQSILSAPIDKCDILLIDEAHRVSAPKISADVAKIRSPVKIFGMTATNEGRSDGAELAAEVLVGPVICRIKYSDAQDAGIISPIKVALVDIDANDCSVHSYDYSTKPGKKRNCYWRNDARNRKYAQAVLTYPKQFGLREDPQILILTETVEHAFRMAKLLPGFEVVYAGMSKDRMNELKRLGLVSMEMQPLSSNRRNQLLKDFEDGKVRKVIATGCWGEGVDFVNLDVVVNMSGAASSITTVQWAGRNSRLYEGKAFGLVIDSFDQWDEWTQGRAKSRIREYREKKWELCQGANYSPELPLT